MAYWWGEALVDLELSLFGEIGSRKWLGNPRFEINKPEVREERMRLLDAFVETNRDRFEALDRAAECTEIAHSPAFAQWSSIYGIEELAAAGVHYAIVHRDRDRAVELLLKTRYLVQTSGSSTGGVLVSPATTRAWVHLIQKEKSPNTLRVWLSRFDDPIMGDDWPTEWARHNYALLSQLLDDPESVRQIMAMMRQHHSQRGLSHRWLYRPKRTRARAAEAYRELIERGLRGERFEPPAPPEGLERVRRILGGNFAGEELLDHMLRSAEFYGNEALAVLATDRMLHTAIALRVRKLEAGGYPRKLAELVPDLLPEVPRDPEDPTGGALRWDPVHNVLWTVGPDRVDQWGQGLGVRRSRRIMSWRGQRFVEPTQDRLSQDRLLLLR